MKIGTEVRRRDRKPLYAGYIGKVYRIEKWNMERKDNGKIEGIEMVCVQQGSSFPWIMKSDLEEVH